jgi:hypothetical protein
VHDRVASSARCTDPGRPYSFECPVKDLPSSSCVQIGVAPSGYYFSCCP